VNHVAPERRVGNEQQPLDIGRLVGGEVDGEVEAPALQRIGEGGRIAPIGHQHLRARHRRAPAPREHRYLVAVLEQQARGVAAQESASADEQDAQAAIP
jgi:hypothetical protein